MRCLTVLLILFVTSLNAQPVQVMTYNLRLDTSADGVNRWDNRKEKVVALIKKYDPDIIGVQEALHHQLVDMVDRLRGYTYFGVGRDDGKQKGEHSAIFIRKKRFTVLEQNTFWLSQTPNVPGSKDWDAAITRVATWGRLKDKKSGRTFLMMNTHFDHIGKEARRQSAGIVKERAGELSQGLPVILTGDFNFKREDPPYQVLMGDSGLRLIDAAPDSPGTFCGFKVGAMPCIAIDYIFHSEHWKAENFRVIQDHDGTYYPSDHLPVMVSLTLSK